MAVAYRSDGKEIAVATIRAAIVFYDTDTAAQKACIEGRADLGYVRKQGDAVSAKKASASKLVFIFIVCFKYWIYFYKKNNLVNILRCVKFFFGCGHDVETSRAEINLLLHAVLLLLLFTFYHYSFLISI